MLHIFLSIDEIDERHHLVLVARYHVLQVAEMEQISKNPEKIVADDKSDNRVISNHVQ